MKMSLILVVLLMLLSAGSAADPGLLTVPESEFLSSLRSTIEIIRRVDVTLRSHNAVSSACMELVGSSHDALHWSVMSLTRPNRKMIGTGDRSSDLRTWLSGTITMLQTCVDDMDNDSMLLPDDMIHETKQTITMVIDLARDLLHKVRPPTRAAHTKKNPFPSWVRRGDLKLIDSVNSFRPNVVVAKDGSGNFTTITEAIQAAPNYSMRRHVIFVKAGKYEEAFVRIPIFKWRIMLVGEGMDRTILSGNASIAPDLKTYHTATFGVSGPGFIAYNMTFENTAGAARNQSVALRSTSDQSVFYRCGIDGFQDTLYPHSMRQFYRECRISGTVDFIFGHATAVFQNCDISVKKGRSDNTITANGRRELDDSGFSFQSCNISADPTLIPYLNSTRTYLGRPWFNFSRTVFMESYMSDVVRPEGWRPWDGTMYLETLFYAEYNNYGPGSGTSGRVRWGGYHVLNESQASEYTVGRFLKGDTWLPSTGVEYISELNTFTISGAPRNLKIGIQHYVAKFLLILTPQLLEFIKTKF